MPKTKTISAVHIPAIRRPFPILMLLVGSWLATDGLALTPCSSLEKRVIKAEDDIKELVRQRDEMEREFKSLLEQDFAAQAETFWDQAHRNNAIKVVYVRNRLNKKIESRRQALTALTGEYCAQCAPGKPDSALKSGFCTRCPDSPACGE